MKSLMLGAQGVPMTRRTKIWSWSRGGDTEVDGGRGIPLESEKVLGGDVEGGIYRDQNRSKKIVTISTPSNPCEISNESQSKIKKMNDAS